METIINEQAIPSTIARLTDIPKDTYSKPSGGIPKTDLASAVQTSLGKADTALQEHQSLDGYIKDTDLAAVATSGSYADLSNKPTIPDALADLSADASHRTVTDTEKATWNAKSDFSGSYNDLSDKPTIPSALTVDSALSSTSTNPVQNKVIDSALSGKQATISDLATIRSGASAGATAIQPDDLATVATSGSYDDLTNKPTIPSAVTIDTTLSTTSTNPAQNKVVTAGINAKYTKPSTGIPKSDLASAVQTSLGKADTALQAHQDISGKQDKLVSGTNIKTVNGTSLLGSGNIVISGGGSGGGSGAYSEVNHGTADTTFTLTPNTFHVWDEVASLTLDFGSETSGVANEFLFQFTSGATATSLTLPDDIKWANDSAPTIEANMIYQVSVLKGLASVLSWANVAELVENNLEIVKSGKSYIINSQYPVESSLKITLSNSSSSSIIFPAGSSSYSIGSSPTTPSIIAIDPSEDNAYKYIW